MKHILWATIALATASNLGAQTTSPGGTAQKKQNPPSTGVKAAPQMTGGVNRFGDLIGLQTGWSFQILSARFTFDPFDDYTRMFPVANEKLLVLSVAIKNMSKGDSAFNPAAHSFQAIDVNNDVHEQTAYKLLSKPGVEFFPSLKPGQGFGQGGVNTVEVAIKVPLNTKLTKLILKQGRFGTKEEVVRFFLAGATEAEAGGKPDPKNVIAALPESAVKGTPDSVTGLYPSNNYYFRIDGFSTADKLGGQDLEEGKKWVIANVTIKNGLSVKQGIWNFHGPVLGDNAVLIDTDGEKYAAVRFIRKKSDDEVSGEFEPNEQLPFRIAFMVPKSATFKSLKYGSVDGHSYLIDASTAGK